MDQPVIILLHGALGAAKELAPIAALLSSHFKVYNYEFSGHGSTPLKAGFSIADFAEELELFITDLEEDSVFIFGFSMGGYVALKTAMGCAKIKRVITLGTKWDWSEESLNHELKKINPVKIKEKVPAFAQYLHQLHQEDWVLNMEKTALLMQTLHQRDQLKQKDFQNLSIPVDLLLGSEDDMVSEKETIAVKELINESSYKVLAGWKHALFCIKPSDLVQEIEAILLSK